MVAVVSLFILIIVFFVATLLGMAFTLTTTIIMRVRKRQDKMKYWLIGAGIGLVVWIVLIILNNNPISDGASSLYGSGKMFTIFPLKILIPGVLFVAGSLGQLVGLIRGVKEPKLEQIDD